MSSGGPTLFDRFTDRARKVMVYARQEAQRLNHDFIGTEHILLGLIKEGGGVAANVLQNLEVDVKKIRIEVEKMVQSSPDVQTKGAPPFTPRAKKIVAFSLEEARALGHNYIGTEHILLGLLRENEGVAAHVLINLNVKFEDVREEVLSLLGADAQAQSGREAETPPLAFSALDLLDAARKEARRLGQVSVSADLVALALFRTKPNAATRALEQLGMEPGLLYTEIGKILSAGTNPAEPTSHP